MTEFAARASAGMKTLHRFYNPHTGLWTTTGWWNSANALETTIDFSARTGDERYLGCVAQTFAKHHRGKFLNEFYDDEGWWALAWIKAYDHTRDPRYLQTAQTIFDDMTRGWDATCGGGIWWKKQHVKKNAVSNELFVSVAARLACRTDRKSPDLDWARRAWDWFAGSGLINEHGLVNDGLNAACENDGGVTWTYNQGVILGGLIALHEATNDDALLMRAQTIADAALAALADANGILHEPNEPRLGADGPQFKGIFVRNLFELYEATRKAAYRDAIVANANAVWSNRGDGDAFGGLWAGPFDRADAARQSAALDALNAAVPFDST